MQIMLFFFRIMLYNNYVNVIMLTSKFSIRRQYI